MKAIAIFQYLNRGIYKSVFFFFKEISPVTPVTLNFDTKPCGSRMSLPGRESASTVELKSSSFLRTRSVDPTPLLIISVVHNSPTRVDLS